MADEKRNPTAPLQAPSVSSGINDSAPTVGVERLKILPDVNIIPEAKNFVRIEQQPEDQIPLEGGLAPERKLSSKVEIKEPISGVSTLRKSSQVAEKNEEPKILTIDDAREVLRENKPLIPIGNYESEVYEATVIEREEEKIAA